MAEQTELDSMNRLRVQAERKAALYRRALVLACFGDEAKVAFYVSDAAAAQEDESGVPVVDGETISPADADAPTAREAELIALLRKAREGLSCGLWDYGAGQDEHEQCDALIAEIDATLKEPNDGR